METKHLLIFWALVCAYAPAPVAAQCNGGTAQIDLNINNISARLQTSGDLWWDGSNAQYVAPKNSNPTTTSLFAGSLWIGGYDPGGGLYLAAQTYGASNGEHEYWPGPLDPVSGTVTGDDCSNWDKFFQVSSAEVLNHRLDFSDNGMVDVTPPNNILGWPAVGNPYFFEIHGFDLPAGNQLLAPFWDQDENGNYDPYAGDYPLVKGDQSIWWVMNDNGNIHGNSQAGPLQIEVHCNAFSYQSDDAYIDHTTFYEYTIINRRNEGLDSTFFSLWFDPDLGCWSDDYIGCDVASQMGFVYNADDLDENCSGLNGYQSTIPILGVKILTPFTSGSGELPFSSFTYYLNASDGNPNPAQTDPNTANEFYNYMTGTWLDGTPFSQGGSGYNPGEAAYSYAFDGALVDNQPWNECTANSTASDRRMLMNFGPGTFPPGSIYKVAFAVLWKADQPHPCPSFDPIIQDGELVADFYEQKCMELEDGGIIINQTYEPQVSTFFSLSPNPTDQSTRIRLLDQGNPIRQIRLSGIDGATIRQWNGIGGTEFQLDRAGLPAGVYLVQVVLENGLVGVQKWVVQ